MYRYDGWFFEWQSYGGPWPLRNDGELRKRAGREFWRMIDCFQKLSPAERKQYRVGGGCTVLTTASTVTAAPVDSAASQDDLARPQVNPDR